MSTRPPTRSHPAESRSEGELEARARLGLEEGLRRLGYRAFRAGQREAIETLLAPGGCCWWRRRAAARA